MEDERIVKEGEPAKLLGKKGSCYREAVRIEGGESAAGGGSCCKGAKAARPERRR